MAGRRRWFASKDQPPAGGAPRRADDHRESRFRVHRDRGGRRRPYRALPSCRPRSPGGSDTTSPLFLLQLALARVRRGRTIGYLTDGVFGAAIRARRAEEMREHAVVPRCRKAKSTSRPPAASANSMRSATRPKSAGLAAEQSNSSLVIADAAVLKLVRRLLDGVHPEAEMSRYPDRTRLCEYRTAVRRGRAQSILREFRIRWRSCKASSTTRATRGNWALELPATLGGRTRRGRRCVAAATPDRTHEEEAIEGYQALTRHDRQTARRTARRARGAVHEARVRTRTGKPPEQVQAWTEDTLSLLASALDVLSRHLDALTDDVKALAQSPAERRAALAQTVAKLVPPDAGRACASVSTVTFISGRYSSRKATRS